MKARLALACLLFLAASSLMADELRYLKTSAYPPAESAAVWRLLGASYVRQALKDGRIDRDPGLNARVDAIMRAVGAAAASFAPNVLAIDWNVLLIEDFGLGATAFPGGTVLVDSRFVRSLALTDDELAFVLSHEVAHILADHPLEKLSFMAETVGREKAPNAGSALKTFFAENSHALLFRPTARLQEREADWIGAAIFSKSGYQAARALDLFDKLDLADGGKAPGTHDPASIRKRAVAAALDDAARTDRR